MDVLTRLVEVVNTNNNPVYLPFSNDEKDTRVIPPKGKTTYRMTQGQIELLKATKLQYNIKG